MKKEQSRTVAISSKGMPNDRLPKSESSALCSILVCQEKLSSLSGSLYSLHLHRADTIFPLVKVTRMSSSICSTKASATEFTMQSEMAWVSMRKVTPVRAVKPQSMTLAPRIKTALITFHLRGIPATDRSTYSIQLSPTYSSPGSLNSTHDSGAVGTLYRSWAILPIRISSSEILNMKIKQQSHRQRRLSAPYSPGSMSWSISLALSGKSFFKESRTKTRLLHDRKSYNRRPST
mmetsp:Transcript_9838/g.18286  ORF Transcript_9838/g.18286 Transcript_9838/m.18286 type:complete len:234 (-) Transcript_9838:502-1203(-)